MNRIPIDEDDYCGSCLDAIRETTTGPICESCNDQLADHLDDICTLLKEMQTRRQPDTKWD